MVAVISAIAGGDITNVPGLVAVPVCTLVEAIVIATNDPSNSAGNPVWPCPPPTADNSLPDIVQSACAAHSLPTNC